MKHLFKKRGFSLVEVILTLGFVAVAIAASLFAYNKANYSAEYASSGFDNENFTTRYDGKTDRFLTANFTSNLNTQNASLWNASGSNLFLKDQAGNVGIGTASPDTKLKVSGDVNITGTVWSQGTNITSGGAGGGLRERSPVDARRSQPR
mgnify:CR=1 FL=1